MVRIVASAIEGPHATELDFHHLTYALPGLKYEARVACCAAQNRIRRFAPI